MKRDLTPNADLSDRRQTWLTEAQTAYRLNLSKKWLQAQRLKGGGIRYAKFGSAVRYSIVDIEDYEAKCLRSSTSEPSRGNGVEQ